MNVLQFYAEGGCGSGFRLETLPAVVLELANDFEGKKGKDRKEADQADLNTKTTPRQQGCHTFTSNFSSEDWIDTRYKVSLPRRRCKNPSRQCAAVVLKDS